ncbi:MAG: RT0821/Lpp0805 family surface protein [Minwuia sp.]|uniref:RT0821/Lpp0805 family surface protein n=1 Tax=Minwuia sp. TaxID=2493630 RepID=UPI003A83627F
MRAVHLIILLLAAGCSSDTFYRDAGSIAGAAAGTAVGGQVGGGLGRQIAVGAASRTGSLVGKDIGSQLDKASKQAAARAQNKALNSPTGQQITWNSPSGQASGAVQTTKQGTHNQTGRTCKAFQHDITINGKVETLTGIACQQPDGTWKVQP